VPFLHPTPCHGDTSHLPPSPAASSLNAGYDFLERIGQLPSASPSPARPFMPQQRGRDGKLSDMAPSAFHLPCPGRCSRRPLGVYKRSLALSMAAPRLNERKQRRLLLDSPVFASLTLFRTSFVSCWPRLPFCPSLATLFTHSFAFRQLWFSVYLHLLQRADY
jgi:hypothetical protein